MENKTLDGVFKHSMVLEEFGDEEERLCTAPDKCNRVN